MSAARAIQLDQREAVRVLAMEIGYREAARKLGLNENTVLQWSKRYNWSVQAHHKNSPASSAITVIRQPGQVILDELHENERATRLSLSRYAARAAKDSEQATIRDAPLVHKVGQLAGIVHKWGDQDKSSTQFTLNVLNINSLQLDSESLDTPEP